jgi:hypothetical protein
MSGFKTLPLLARGIIILSAAAGGASLAAAFWYQSIFGVTRLAFLPLLAAFGAHHKGKLYNGTSISYLASVVMIGVISDEPAVSMLAAICGVTIQTLSPSKRVIPHRLIFNAGMVTLTVAATWWTHRVLATGTHSLDATSSEMVATILASFVYFLVNSICVALIVSATKRKSVFDICRHFMYSAPSFVSAGLLAVGFVGLMSDHAALPIALTLVASITYYTATRRAGEQQDVSGQ